MNEAFIETDHEHEANHPGDFSAVELAQLRVRVIALENLIISLLATASGRQLSVAQSMASYIAPRPGYTPHQLTVQAASHMGQLVQRASQFRGTGQWRNIMKKSLVETSTISMRIADSPILKLHSCAAWLTGRPMIPSMT